MCLVKEILFGAYNIKKKNQNIENIILCEGYMDVIALYKFGYPAVASLGTAVSEKQIDLLTKLSKNIFLYSMVIRLVKMLRKII